MSESSDTLEYPIMILERHLSRELNRFEVFQIEEHAEALEKAIDVLKNYEE